MEEHERDQSMLSCYRVQHLTDGSLCGKILAELGADVTKIEKSGTNTKSFDNKNQTSVLLISDNELENSDIHIQKIIVDWKPA